MKALFAVLLLSATAAFGQAQFAGEWLMVENTLRCPTPGWERSLMFLYVESDGTITGDNWSFDFDYLEDLRGTVDAKGRFQVSSDSGVYYKGKLNVRGTGKATGVSATCRSIVQLFRREL